MKNLSLYSWDKKYLSENQKEKIIQIIFSIIDENTNSKLMMFEIADWIR